MRLFLIVAVLLLSACADMPYLPKGVFEESQWSVEADDSARSGVLMRDELSQSPENFDRAAIEVVSSEVLLDANGSWDVVEQQRIMDPAKAHLAARQKVDVRRRSKMDELAAHFEPDAKSGQDGTLRVIRIRADEGDFDHKDVEIAQTPAPHPQLKVARTTSERPEEKSRVLAEIRSLFDRGKKDERGVHQESAGKAVITPPAIPAFRQQKAGGGVVVPGRKPVRAVRQARVVSREAGVLPKEKPVVSARKREAVYQRGGRSALVSDALKIRSGRHPGKTRFVIEVSAITKYKVAIDPLRNVLRMKMENTRWQMRPQGVLRGSKLLGTYIAREQEDGSVLLEVRLNDQTKITGTMVLPPNDVARSRVVIDLKD